ncbi:hypothetical protein M2161_007327 [Streptomyces sp. SAI-133]|uniref:hypothetical protein n=1 Tax=unclassified Streptomyces TaxID=2593676 RepID=UPI0024756028|nr:hypothetical protein [Streptomyces sp. SAI-133]MDH6588221.1 hypothetical protein [Streptomyces sp. SAI-133]
MAVDQLPGRMREFVAYLSGVLARLDQGAGWCAVFWQRDPDGMQACLDGREVPPWDVVEALLQDYATVYGPAAAHAEAERARPLHAAAQTAHDARPGGRDALGDRFDVMLREQRYAAERQAELGRRLAAATTQEEADAIRLDLAWARDDHERAVRRCAELRSRMAELDRLTRNGQAWAVRRGRDADGAGFGVTGAHGEGGVGRHEEGARGAGAHEAGAHEAGAHEAGVREADGRDADGRHAPVPEMPRQRDARSATHPEAPATGPAPQWPSPAAHPASQVPYPQDQTLASEQWPSPAPHPKAPGPHPAAPAPYPQDRNQAPEQRTAPAPDARPDRTPPQQPAPTAPPPPEAKRKRRRGGARFAGMAEEDGAPVVVPPSAVPDLPSAPVAKGRAPRGARFAGAAEVPEAAPRERAEPLDAAARRETAETVATLVRLRSEGRTGDAHALLVEVAHWPADRFPLLAAELQHAGLGADWATLLWEAASLPADRLVAAADALVAAGRSADGEQVLRQGVARPAGEIGAAVLGLVAEGRRREVTALLDAYVRVRTPEEAARSAAPGPATLVPLLLAAARGVSDERHWDLVHALRVAGFSA